MKSVAADSDELLFQPKPVRLHEERNGLPSKLSAFITGNRPTHFVRVVLFEDTCQFSLQEVLNDWLIRVNRCYLGRRWYTPTLKSGAMIAFMQMAPFESLADPQAFLLVRPPIPADLGDFMVRAPMFFLGPMEDAFSALGHMTLESIGALGMTTEEIVRLFISSATKS